MFPDRFSGDRSFVMKLTSSVLRKNRERLAYKDSDVIGDRLGVEEGSENETKRVCWNDGVLTKTRLEGFPRKSLRKSSDAVKQPDLSGCCKLTVMLDNVKPRKGDKPRRRCSASIVLRRARASSVELKVTKGRRRCVLGDREVGGFSLQH